MRKNFVVDKEYTFRGRILNFILKIVVSPIVRIVWSKETTGKENLPKEGPYIIAANHQSFLDFVLLFCVLSHRRLRFLAAEKFYNSKYSRALMEFTGQIKVNRYDKNCKDEVISIGLEVLKAGEVLVIFPQGTRSRSGKIEKTYTGVVKFAMLSGVSVVPVGIRGAYRTWPPHAKKPLFKKQISLHFGMPIKFEKNNVSAQGELSREELKQRTEQIMRKIAKLAEKEYENYQ